MTTTTDRESDRAGLLSSWRGVLLRRWRVGGLLFVLVLGLVAAVVLLASPVYRADARLRLGEPPPMTGVSPTSSFFGLLRMGGDPFANDLELIGSRTLNEQLVDDAALTATVASPRGWHRDSLFTRFETTRATAKASFAVEWIEDGRIAIRQRSPRDSAIATVAAGEPASFGGLVVAFQPWRPAMPREIAISTLPFDDAARLTRERLQVERTRREANVVELAYDYTDPAVAHAVVASAVNRFTALRTGIQQRESGETVDSLRTVARETMAELRAAESALEDVQRTTRLVVPEAQGEAFVERYADVSAWLATARMELAAIDSVLSRASAAEAAAAWTTLLAYPRFLENENVGALLTRITELEQERRELATRRAEQSREYGVLVDQIGYLDGTLRRLAEGYRAALTEQVVDLGRQVAELEATLDAVPAQTMALARSQRDVRILTEIVVLTEQRLRQEELRQALTFANVQVIDPPALRRRPVWPRKKLGLAVGFVLAGMTAALGMVVTERADRSVRRASQVRATLGAPVLAAFTTNGRAGALASTEASAIVRRAGGRIAVAGVGSGDAASVARLVASGFTGNGASPPQITVVDRIDTFAAAANAAATGTVLLVVAHGRTGVDELVRAAELLREASADVAGAVLVYRRPRERPDVWT
jgi:uncharacterized protein involved in exopolysaccharide biosynthesis